MAAKKKAARKRESPKTSPRKKSKRWSHKISSDSTHPPAGLFTKDAETVARIMATKKVSPGGLGSAIRMVQMFINRAGENLSIERRKELEKAKRILQQKTRSNHN